MHAKLVLKTKPLVLKYLMNFSLENLTYDGDSLKFERPELISELFSLPSFCLQYA